MPTPTSKLGLLKPAGVEPQDIAALNSNSDVIDKVMGGYIVNDDVTPPDSDLYPGCIVTEKVSGWSWQAVSNGTGGFNKLWLTRHHWLGVERTTTFAVPDSTGGATTPFILSSLSEVGKKNWDSKGGESIAAGFKVPIANAIYRVDVQATYVANATGYRAIGLATTAGNTYITNLFTLAQAITAGTISTIVSHTALLLGISPNTQMSIGLRQNSGAALNCTNCRATLTYQGQVS